MEEAIPPYWAVVNPGGASDNAGDEGSIFKQITPDMIQLTSNPMAKDGEDVGVILYTK